MPHGRSRFALVFAALALAAPAVFAEESRVADRVAVIKSVAISGETAILTLADDSTIEMRAADIRIHSLRGREGGRREVRSTASASPAKRDRGDRGPRGVMRAADLQKLVETSGPQSLLLRLRYDAAGRVRAARGELHATEAEAVAAMSVRAERRQAAEARKAKPASTQD